MFTNQIVLARIFLTTLEMEIAKKYERVCKYCQPFDSLSSVLESQKLIRFWNISESILIIHIFGEKYTFQSVSHDY